MRSSAGLVVLSIALLSPVVFAQTSSPSIPPATTAPVVPPASAPAPTEAPPMTTPAPTSVPKPADATRGERMRAYHAALTQRRLGSDQNMTRELAAFRVAEAELMISTGRHDEAIARMTEVVEHPQFGDVAETQEGRAALYLLGHALAQAGINETARGYLRRSIAAKGAWEQYGPYARRAVRRIVEIALDTRAYAGGLKDLETVPANAPPEIRGEVMYLTGKSKEASGDPDGALAAYAQVPQTSRFWSQATYLSGIVQTLRGKFKEGEALFCKVADPKRQDKTTPVFADERFFAVRDLARLALGRVAHEQYRFDDARYYYYLVPRDSDRLAEALYEAATTRYEKKDYEGARELLDELNALKTTHHRYEDEARILDAYIDLAQCKFPEADRKLVFFLRKYEPVRDAARRLGNSERGTRALLAAARAGADSGGGDFASVTPDQLRAVAALVRIDPLYGEISQKRAVLEHESSGLRLASLTLGDMQRSLATSGGVRPSVDEPNAPALKAADARAALEGVRRQIDDLEQARAGEARVGPLKKELVDLETRLGDAPERSSDLAAAQASAGTDLPDLLRNDSAYAAQLNRDLENVRTDLTAAETALAKDALHRLDLRLSRLLRRARLGRIESVLGKKRSLEVEIEAINAGYLPKDALDSLDAARYLKDNEQYWPFEGDDWPDEFVGSEGLK